MPRESITSIDILKFIDGEFRTAARDVLDLHSLEIAEREEKFRCLPVVHRGNNVFSFTKNSSKFRTGDYILLNPYTKDMKGEPSNSKFGLTHFSRPVCCFAESCI